MWGAVHPLGIFKISKTKMLITLPEKCDTLPRPRVASVEPLLLDTTRFLKMYVCAKCFVQCYGGHCGIEFLIFRS